MLQTQRHVYRGEADEKHDRNKLSTTTFSFISNIFGTIDEFYFRFLFLLITHSLVSKTLARH